MILVRFVILTVLVVLVAGCTTPGLVNDQTIGTTELPTQEMANSKTEQVPLTIGDAKLMVEVRDTDAERELGLSYRESMGEDEGMVFIFDQPAPYSFWMLGMEFPLDMIWVRNGVVVDISERVPQTHEGVSEQPATRTPTEPVDMVVEVNGGWVEKNGIKVGDEVKLSTRE